MVHTVEAEADKSPGHLNFDPLVEFIPGRGVPPQEPKLESYTVEEVAKMLGMCEQTIRRYIRCGELEGWQLGQLYRIPRYALDEYLERSRLRACGTLPAGKRQHVEPLLTPKEVQGILRISPDCFRRLVRFDQLPIVWIGSLMRVQPVELQAWINDRDRRKKASTSETQRS